LREKIEVSRTVQPVARAARMASVTAWRLSTGSAPGRPRHTGHTLVLGGSPNRLRQAQKILVAVRSWTWTSSPMTGSKRASTPSRAAVAVAMDQRFYRLNSPALNG
jgi:hypothetical protein